jgi:hypothetical protein
MMPHSPTSLQAALESIGCTCGRDVVQVDGIYPLRPEDKGDEGVLHFIHITHGYSQNHRPDLKQFLVQMMVMGEGGVPTL